MNSLLRPVELLTPSDLVAGRQKAGSQLVASDLLHAGVRFLSSE